MATFSAGFSSVTQTTAVFQATFSGGDAGYGGWRYVELVITGDDTYLITSQKAGGGTSTFYKKITGLSPSSSYRWTATLGYESGSGIQWLTLTDSGILYTESAGLGIQPWFWTKSNGEATTVMTQEAYDVLWGRLPASEFSHYVWNDLVDKVYEMRRAKGYSWDTASGRYPSYAGCKLYAGDVLSAKIFNGVKYNVGTINPTFSDVQSGDRIYGQYFTILTDRLNEIINGEV